MGTIDYWTELFAQLVENKITPACDECGQFISRTSVLHGLVVIGDPAGGSIKDRTYTHPECLVWDDEDDDCCGSYQPEMGSSLDNQPRYDDGFQD